MCNLEPSAMTDPYAVPPFTPGAVPAGAPADASRLPVRRLRVDLSRGFDRLWNGGDSFRTHYLNALSMSFPVGEQFFIDSVRKGVSLLPPGDQPRWAGELRGFVGQEATHRFLHAQFNAELERQGLRNRWQGWAEKRIERSAGLHPINHVAVTAGYEHFTAVLATGMLTHPEWLAGASPELALLWRWHAVEESEHKTVAFDLYRAMGGSDTRRILWFVYIGLLFLVESALQTWLNLWHSGRWWRPSTWGQGLRFMLGARGVWWASLVPLLHYLRPGFHPAQLENAAEMAQWLEAQRSAYAIVGE
jgi:predicted metal-dependent hydrolase